MNSLREDVEQHYSRRRILDLILVALRETGKDLARLKPEDLAPVDEFHIRGREATVELAHRASFWPRARVLDVGVASGAPHVTLPQNTSAR
jgi:MPBQ/MSBQ methyltransferase